MPVASRKPAELPVVRQDDGRVRAGWLGPGGQGEIEPELVCTTGEGTLTEARELMIQINDVWPKPVIIREGHLGKGHMTLSGEERLRRDLLLKALEVFRDTEAAMAATLEMERFVRGPGSVSRSAGLSVRRDVCGDDPCLRLVPDGPAGEAGQRRRWTETEDAQLRRLWSEGLTARAISERMQRSEASLATRASILKLKRVAGRPLVRGAERNGHGAGVAAVAAVQASDGDDAAPRPVVRARRAADAGRTAGSGTDAARNGRRTAARPCGAPEGSIETVVDFLRSRDYSVVRTGDGRFRLDEREDLTARELLTRANKIRAHLRQPPFSAMAC